MVRNVDPVATLVGPVIPISCDGLLVENKGVRMPPFGFSGMAVIAGTTDWFPA